MVGRDGVANGTSALDGKVSLHRGIIQIAGKAATVRPDTLRTLAREFEPLQHLLIRHEQVLLAQAQQSAGCNASHSVEARMWRPQKKPRGLVSRAAEWSSPCSSIGGYGDDRWSPSRRQRAASTDHSTVGHHAQGMLRAVRVAAGCVEAGASGRAQQHRALGIAARRKPTEV